jgi:hypothetical protein
MLTTQVAIAPQDMCGAAALGGHQYTRLFGVLWLSQPMFRKECPKGDFPIVS